MVTHNSSIDEENVPELFIIEGSVPASTTSAPDTASIVGVKRGREDGDDGAPSGNTVSTTATAAPDDEGDDVIMFVDASERQVDADDIMIVEKKARVE